MSRGVLGDGNGVTKKKERRMTAKEKISKKMEDGTTCINSTETFAD